MDEQKFYTTALTDEAKQRVAKLEEVDRIEPFKGALGASTRVNGNPVYKVFLKEGYALHQLTNAVEREIGAT